MGLNNEIKKIHKRDKKKQLEIKRTCTKYKENKY
jgi:hypothetical protein